LKPGGYAILSVPQKDHLGRAIGDPDITDPEERLLEYGQRDHLRIYGWDFKEMLSSAGFNVAIVNEKSFPKRYAKKHVLYPPILSTRELATNFRKIYFARK
jgi:hypothetical protein